MKIGIPKERRDEERRAAASPDTVKRYKGMGLEPVVEAGAGVGAAVADQAYQDAGAAIGDEAGAWASEIVLKVQRPTEAEMGHLRPGPGPDRHARPLQRQGSGRGLRQGRGQRLRHGAAAAHHARPGHGRALQPGQPRRLQGAGRRHGRVQPCAADDDDRGRHGDPGQGVHRRRRRGRAAGDRHGPAHGGGGDRDRRAPGGARGDREPGRQVRGLRAGGCRDQGRLCPAADARGAGRAGQDGGRAPQDPGHRRDHGPDPGPQGAADRHRPRWSSR